MKLHGYVGTAFISSDELLHMCATYILDLANKSVRTID